jgi:hypothetical protein
MRIRQFRAPIETKVHVPRVSRDIAESASPDPGQLEDDDLDVDGVQEFLSLGRFVQHHFAQCKREMRHLWRTCCKQVEKLCAGHLHASKLISLK